MSQSEMRRATRFDVQLNCRVSSPVPSFRDLPGVTVNMSRLGLLVAFPDAHQLEPPPIGTPVRITVELPGPGGTPPRLLECLGRVVRIADSGSAKRVAFTLQRYQFQGPADSPAGEPISNNGSPGDY